MKSLVISLFLILFSSPVCNFEETLNLIWVEVASAERQCIQPTYTSLDDAVDQLTSNRIEVFDQKEINLIVCRACNCPTGVVYQAQIDNSDFDRAKSFGWRLANNYGE